MNAFADKARDRWTITGAAAASGGTTVTKTAVEDDTHVATSIDCSGDAAALVTIESPASTVLWRKRFAAAFTTTANFEAGGLQGANSQALLVKVSASTSNVEANMTGFTI